MNVRWTGVVVGFLVDTMLSFILLVLANRPDFARMLDLAQTSDVILLALLTISTGVGGYVAGRMAHADRTLNGFLVGIVGVLVGQMQNSASFPRPIVVASAVACVLAGLGGFLSRYPAPRERQSSGQR